MFDTLILMQILMYTLMLYVLIPMGIMAYKDIKKEYMNNRNKQEIK